MSMLPIFLVFFALLEVGLALGLAVHLRARHAELVGSVLHEQLAPRKARTLGLVLMGAAAVIGLLVEFQIGIFAVVLLTPAAAAWWLAPAAEDQRCGVSGVQYGWSSRSLEQLELWRLTGDHLRFRLNGLWVAVALPRALHAQVRERLESMGAGRESEYGS